VAIALATTASRSPFRCRRGPGAFAASLASAASGSREGTVSVSSAKRSAGSSNLIGGTPGFVGGGDYHLRPGSPAIDRDDNAFVPPDLTTDADGDPRIANAGSGTATVDIGWDEAVTGWQPSPGDGGRDGGRGDGGSPDGGPSGAGPPDAGAPLPDAGPTAGPLPSPGCGCQAASGTSAVLGALAAVAWLAARRRRPG